MMYAAAQGVKVAHANLAHWQSPAEPLWLRHGTAQLPRQLIVALDNGVTLTDACAQWC